MSDTASIAIAQRTFWNSEATRRWVTEQARIDRLMADVTEAALAAAAPKRGGARPGCRLWDRHDRSKVGRSGWAERSRVGR